VADCVKGLRCGGFGIGWGTMKATNTDHHFAQTPIMTETTKQPPSRPRTGVDILGPRTFGRVNWIGWHYFIFPIFFMPLFFAATLLVAFFIWEFNRSTVSVLMCLTSLDGASES